MKPITNMLDIPLIHYSIHEVVDRRLSTRIILPLIYSFIVIYLIMNSGVVYRLYLSTIPVLGDLHAPIILVADQLSIIFLVVITLLYFKVALTGVDKFKYIILSMLSINCLSMDLLLSQIILFVIVIYMFHKKEYRDVGKLLLISPALFTLGYILTNSINIGVLLYNYSFQNVDKQVLGLGLYTYLINYIYVSWLSIELKPLFRDHWLHNEDLDLYLQLYSLPLLLRLNPFLGLLCNDSHYRLYLYTAILLASVNILYNTIKTIETNVNQYVTAYDYSYLAFLLPLYTPLSIYTMILQLLVNAIYRVLPCIKRVNFSKAILFSKIGLFPLPGFIVKILTIYVVYTVIGFIGIILPLISIVFTHFNYYNQVKTTYHQYTPQYLFLTSILLIILLFTPYIIDIGVELLFLRRYYSYVFGV